MQISLKYFWFNYRAVFSYRKIQLILTHQFNYLYYYGLFDYKPIQNGLCQVYIIIQFDYVHKT